MFSQILLAIATLSIFSSHTVLGSTSHVLGERQFSLTDRYAVQSVSDVFKDNILLTLFYMRGKINKGDSVHWTEVRKPFSYSVTIDSGKTFAFHDSILPEYKDKIEATTNAHFNSYEGFESDGWLIGDGVCHLASLINWAARDAKLDVVAPTNHNFANIPEVPKEYGTAIFASPDGAGALQNLYVTNNHAKPIEINFIYDGKELSVSITENE